MSASLTFRDSPRSSSTIAAGILTSVMVVAAAGMAELPVYDAQDWRDWIPDMAAGLGFLIGGILVRHRGADTLVWCMFLAVGAAWFTYNLGYLGVEPFVWLGANLTFLYLGLVSHLAFVIPRSRPLAVLERTALAAGYVVAVWPTGELNPSLRLGLIAGLLCTVALRRLVVRRGEVPAPMVAAIVVGLTALARHLSGPLDQTIARAYALALCGVAVLFVHRTTRAATRPEAVVDLVVGLSEARSLTLLDELRRAVGDPALEIGYRVGEREGYVRADGTDLLLEGGSEVVTRLSERAILVHDGGSLTTRSLTDAVAAAASLAATHAELQSELRVREADLRRSRARLMTAGEEGRRRLEHELRIGAESRLTRVVDLLGDVPADDPTLRGTLDRAYAHAAQTLVDLRAIAGGLHPRALVVDGLTGAVGVLARLCPVPVEVSVEVDRVDAAAERVAYYVCAEGLANVAKHSGATTASVTIGMRSNTLWVVVDDDGVGGAATSTNGSGLSGLSERIEALGGRLAVTDRPGGGTRLGAEIPLAAEPRAVLSGS